MMPIAYRRNSTRAEDAVQALALQGIPAEKTYVPSAYGIFGMYLICTDHPDINKAVSVIENTYASTTWEHKALKNLRRDQKLFPYTAALFFVLIIITLVGL